MRLRELEGAGLFAIPAGALLACGGLWLTGDHQFIDYVMLAGVWPVLLVLIYTMLRAMLAGRFGLDIVAAFSMAGALWLGEYLAGLIVALMFSGGTMLESYAQYRAKRDMASLLERRPQFAHRYGDQIVEKIAIEAVSLRDILLVKAGEIVPVDGEVYGDSPAELDESALTGEPLPVVHRPGAAILSGTVNVGAPFDMCVTARAGQSTYDGIIRLVDQAQQSKAPSQRLADQYAVGFLLLTAAMAFATYIFTGDPIRVLAVLVIATPCPLILAVPVAVVAGMSASARRGVLIKSGGALERLAGVKVLLFDKTGTLTQGRPEVISIKPAPGFTAEEILSAAASLEQASHHGVGEALIAHARALGLKLTKPTQVQETPGEGLVGQVGDKMIAAGAVEFVAAKIDASLPKAHALAAGEGVALTVLVAINQQLAGAIRLADRIRPEAKQAITRARAFGLERIVMVTGDRCDVAQEVGRQLGVDEIHAELKPADKVAIIAAEQAKLPALMVGDGMNDAPALAAAGVGMAMGARGSAASAEAADAVVIVDDISRVADALEVAGHARNVALQSVGLGMGLSILGMVASAFGLLTPIEGALAQEVIDAAAVLNALRALRA